MTQNDPFGFVGLTYDDVLLLPGESDIMPSGVTTKTKISKRLEINVPLLSSAMDTVTEARMEDLGGKLYAYATATQLVLED